MDQFNYALEELGCMSMRFVIEFGGCLDTVRLMQAVDVTLGMVPVLRSRFVEAQAPCWELLPSWTAREIVTVHQSAGGGETLQEVLTFPVNPKTRPPLRLDIVRSADGHDTLCIAVHHAAMDARGLIVYAEILAALYRAPSLRESVSPVTDLDRSLAAVLVRFRENGCAVLSPPERELHPGWAFPAPDGGVEEQAYIVRTLPADRLSEIKAFAHRSGGKVNDLLLAAFFSGLCDFICPDPGLHVPVLVSIDLRKYRDGDKPTRLAGAPTHNGARLSALAREIVNYSVAFDILMPTGTFTFEDRVRQANTGMQEHKEHDPGLSSEVDIESHGYDGFDGIRERVELMKSHAGGSASKTPFLGNIGIIPEQTVAFSPELSVRNAYVTGIVLNPPGIALAVTTFRNRLTLSIGYGSASISPVVMEDFLDTVVSYLSGNPQSRDRGCEE
jgi:NRPS condensation-like uncharacterized protein